MVMLFTHPLIPSFAHSLLAVLFCGTGCPGLLYAHQSFPLGSRVLCVARTFLVASYNPDAAVERLITGAKIGA